MAGPKYKYQELKNYLTECIRSGVFGEEEQIEPELSLMKRFALSRNTVRQALRELENEGFIYRIRGRAVLSGKILQWNPGRSPFCCTVPPIRRIR